MLVVGSDELIVGDDEDASLEAAEGRCAGGFWDITRGKTTAVTRIRISEGAWAVTGAAHTVLDLSCGHS